MLHQTSTVEDERQIWLAVGCRLSCTWGPGVRSRLHMQKETLTGHRIRGQRETHSGQHFVNMFTSPQNLIKTNKEQETLAPPKQEVSHTMCAHAQFGLSNDAPKCISKFPPHCNKVLFGACCCLTAHSSKPFPPSVRKPRLCYTECRGMTNLHPNGEW